ncbi:MAG TPA: hypothetical protein VEL07_18470 [Planctomycetota bacterium]|nr:hypothetical protein [Planctomycetota bacterium]
MCATCDPWHVAVAVATPVAWRAQVERVQAAIAEDELEVVEGPRPETDRPAGARKHVLQCTRCAQLFILEAGGCHLSGDRWRPLHGN